MQNENNERQTNFEEIGHNTYVTVGVAKLISNVRDVVHEIDNFSHNMYVYDNQMLPCDILGCVGDMGDMVEKLQMRLSQLATVASTFDEIWDYSQDYRRDEYKNATPALPNVEVSYAIRNLTTCPACGGEKDKHQVLCDNCWACVNENNDQNRLDVEEGTTQALPTVEGIDENGDTYDIESPTTMRDLA